MLSELKNPAINGRERRADCRLRRPEGPTRRHHRGLAAGDRAVVRRASGPQQPALRRQAALIEDQHRSEEGLHRTDGGRGRGRVRGLRHLLAAQVPGHGGDVGTLLDGVRRVPRLPPEVRKLVYTTNGIESLNARFRAAIRRRGHFPTEQSALKILYLTVLERRPNRANPTGRIPDWKAILNVLAITYPDRITIH